MSDVINNPKHYTQVRINGMPVECIDVIEALNLPPHLANAMKYIWRYREKGGMEDIRKAGWYCNRYADWQQAKRAPQATPDPPAHTDPESDMD